MKKSMVLCALLAGTASAALAQESRQDVSVSGTFLIAPQVNGNAAQLNTNGALGALASYRYMLTPRSALEVNYGFAQYVDHLRDPQALFDVHTRQQELSLGYVYSRNYRRYNPFLEGGVAGVAFSPIQDNKTKTIGSQRNVSLGGMFGGGVAYEISPSFDLRVQYHAVVVKAPDFKIQQVGSSANFSTNRYEIISTPAVGIAYHF